MRTPWRRKPSSNNEGFIITIQGLWKEVRRFLNRTFLRTLESSSSRLLQERPSSLLEFVNLLQLTDCLWMNEHTFVCEGRKQSEEYERAYFGLRLTCPTSSKRYVLKIHSTTAEEATECLQYLVSLPDSVFQKIGVWTYQEGLTFEEECLEQILCNTQRHVTFSRMFFTPEQSHMLATRAASLGLYQCCFIDGGQTFVDHLIGRTDKTKGPRKLNISGLPFNESQWQRFLQNINGNVDSLLLYFVPYTLDNSHAIAATNIDHLHVDISRMEDRGAALMKAIRDGYGPRSLSLWNERFGRMEQWSQIFEPLRSRQCQLQRFELGRLPGDAQTTVLRALATALQDNTSLQELVIANVSLSPDAFGELLQVLALHPTLRALNVTMKQGVHPTRNHRQCTRAVAQLLSINPRIDAVAYHESTYEALAWKELVQPRLEHNRDRRRSLALQQMSSNAEDDDDDNNNSISRAALLGTAVSMSKQSPSRVWLMLSFNQDVVASQLALRL